jgi:putative transposase
MAYRVTQRIISSDDLLYPYFDDLCRKSKLLYNAALFRVRNIFTGYDKEHRTENEVEVFQEVALLQRSYPNMHVRRVISYTHIEKMMRVTENADFFSGLPRQTAQQMVKQSVTDFKNWLASFNTGSEERFEKYKRCFCKGSFKDIPISSRYKTASWFVMITVVRSLFL